MPKTIPKVSFFRTLIRARKLFENPIRELDGYLDEFQTDTYRTHMGPKVKVLFTKNPAIAKHVLQKNHKNYYKSELQSVILAKYLGKGLLTTNGEYWLRQRRLIQPGFHKKNLNSFLQIMNNEIKDFIQNLSQKYPDKMSTMDLSLEMSRLTIRVVSRALFSSQVDDEEIIFIGKAVDHLQIAISKDIRLPFMAWWRQLNGEERENNRISKKLFELIQNKIEYRKQNSNEHGDLLDMLLQVRYEETGEGMTARQLLDEILVLYAAGYETTANSLAWTFQLLAENPAQLKQLLEEVDSTDLSGELKMDSIFRLPYTAKVSAESLRLFPPAWIIDRVALADDEVDGISIKKGEIVNIYILGIHRSEKYWKDPLQFNPDRFDGDKHIKTDFTYMPFGGGPRLCIGFQFAKLELSLVLHYILQHYSISLPSNESIAIKPLVTLKPKEGIKMNMERRH